MSILAMPSTSCTSTLMARVGLILLPVLALPALAFPSGMTVTSSSASGLDANAVMSQLMSHFIRSMADAPTNSDNRISQKFPAVVIQAVHSVPEEEVSQQPEDGDGAEAASNRDLMLMPPALRDSHAGMPKFISFSNCHVFINVHGGSQQGFYAGLGNSNSTRAEVPDSSNALETSKYPAPAPPPGIMLTLEDLMRRSVLPDSLESPVSSGSGSEHSSSSSNPSTASPPVAEPASSNELSPSSSKYSLVYRPAPRPFFLL